MRESIRKYLIHLILAFLLVCSIVAIPINGRLGYQAGYGSGYSVGHANGYTDGETAGYQRGYQQGNVDGYTNGYDAGEMQGVEAWINQRCFSYPFLLINPLTHVACSVS